MDPGAVTRCSAGYSIWTECNRIDHHCLFHHQVAPAHQGISSGTTGLTSLHTIADITTFYAVDSGDDGILPPALDLLGPGIYQYGYLAVAFHNTPRCQAEVSRVLTGHRTLMSKWLKLKDADQETGLICRRIAVSGMLVALVFLAMLSRVFYLQIVLHDHYSTLSQSNRVKVVPIAPTRGLIFSHDGVLLADNRPSFSLEVIPEKTADMDKLLQQITAIMGLDATDVSQFKIRLKQKRRFESVPLVFNLSDEEVARIAVDLHRLPGVDVVARLNRYYPLGSNTAHTIGYVGMINEDELKDLDISNYSATSHMGKLGVEKAYEGLLHGRVGYQQVEVNAHGRVVRVLDRTPPIPGKNIYLTLDLSLQNLAVQALAGQRGAVVAVDPDTGGVLAMVSSPGYDPNLFVNGIDSKTYNEYLASAEAPLLNRVLQGKYPPGSTIKPMLSLAALRYGVRIPTDTVWCPGWYILKGTSLKKGDWKKGGHGHTSLGKAIAESCDVYFYSLANDLGIDRIHESLYQFGLGQKTGVDITGESAGLLPSREWKRKAHNEAWYPGETLNIGIGQGTILVTPIQLVVTTAAIASRGKVLKPHLFSEARDPVSSKLIRRAGVEQMHVVSNAEDQWDKVISAMSDVVHAANGTARKTGEGALYRFAGKSGTAQVFSLAEDEKYEADKLVKELHDHALFIAFAPLDRPRIALAIIIENGGGGSANAAPIARMLFDNYLNRLEPVQLPVKYETADLL